MSFKRYEGTTRGSRIRQPAITVAKTGRIHINASASKSFDGYEYADLYYDGGTRRVGVKPVKKPKVGTLKLVGRGRSRGCAVVAEGFYKSNRIPHEKTKVFSAEWDDDEEMLIASLEDPLATRD